MKDNFDLKKFLVENKSIENTNPYLKENQYEKDAEAGELNVYGYQTQHFDICPAATSLFKRILDGELGDLSEVAIKNMAKINDQLFLLEKKVIKKGQASEQQVIIAKMAQQALINLALQMGIPEEEFDYVQAHVDKIKSFSNLEEESKDIKSKIREMVINELGGDPELDYEGASEEEMYGDYDDDEKSYYQHSHKTDIELEEMMDPEDEMDTDEMDADEALAQQMDADEYETYADALGSMPFEESLDEAKEDEEEEIETDESEDTEEAPEEEVEAEEEETETGGGIEDLAADMDGNEGDLMDHLISALKVSKGMDNEKLTTQIGNTLKFFVGEYIGGEE